MLNYSRIENLINSSTKPKEKLYLELKFKRSTFFSRLKDHDWDYNDAAKVATYFKKPLVYFLDEEEIPLVVNEKEASYQRKCMQCEEKQKEIDRLCLKLSETQEKYIVALEELSGKNTNRHCG